LIKYFTFYLILLTAILFADPRQTYVIKHANQPYMEWSEPEEVLSRDLRMLKQGMTGNFYNFKAHFNAITMINVPGVKRYKFVNYMVNDEHIVPIQYIDWKKERPIITNQPLDLYVSGKLNFFCLEPQNDVPLYTFDGRMFRDSEGILRSVAHHLPIMGVDDGYIYLSTNDPDIDEMGRIYEDDVFVGQIKIESFESPNGMWTIEGSVFYPRQPNLIQPNESPEYEIIQGYYEGQNEPPGMMTSKLIAPFQEATAKSAKKYLESYELLFQALNEN